MKKSILSLLATTAVTALLSGCFSDSESLVASNAKDSVAVTTPKLDSSLQKIRSTLASRTGTLQGCIYDATTGKPLAGKSLQIFLVQGSSDRTPTKLITSESDALAGEYAFDSIPLTSVSKLDNTFKLVVVRDNFYRFESEFSFAVANDSAPAIYNKIGNVFLYPSPDTAQTVRVTTVCGTVNCKGVTVALKPVKFWSDDTISTTTAATPTSSSNNVGAGRDTRLYPTNVKGDYNAITAVTDDKGIATFPGSALTLGALYTPITTAFTTSAGMRYLQTNGTVFLAGLQNGTGTQDIVMKAAVNTMPAVTVLSSSADSSGLYEGKDSSLKISFNFSRPISLVNEGGFDIAMNDFDSLRIDTTLNDSTVGLQKLTTFLFVANTHASTVASYPWPGYHIDSLSNPDIFTVYARRVILRSNYVSKLAYDNAVSASLNNYDKTTYSHDTLVTRWVSRETDGTGMYITAANAALSKDGQQLVVTIKTNRTYAKSASANVTEKISVILSPSTSDPVSYFTRGYEDISSGPAKLFSILPQTSWTASY